MQAITTLEYADKYIEMKLDNDSWTALTDMDKNKLLLEATRRIYAIDGFKYTPEVIELLSAIPDDLQQACCEVALTLTKIDENDPHVVNMALGITSISFGQDSASYSDNASSQIMPAYVFNDYARSILNKYILKGCKYV